MKKISFTSLIIAIAIVSACSSSKKATTASSSANNSASTATEAMTSKGIIVPGEAQLNAIKTKYSDATLQQLSNGYAIYNGACVDCHGAKSIYNRNESRWTSIIDDMSPKAHLTDAQKNDLTKYIMSIKATQPQQAK